MPKNSLPEAVCRSTPTVDGVGSILAARSDGIEFTLAAKDSKRKELLAAVRSGQASAAEVEIDLRGFQQTDEPNANFLRFKPAILGKLAKSFAGVPLQKDHNRDLDARAGTVLSSKAVKIEGGTAFEMTARLTAPWAIEALLAGNLDRFSIGWDHGGLDTLECSACKCAVFTQCSHFPGDMLENGKRVEFVFTEAAGVELSAVSVPAVKGTGISEIRAALSQAAAMIAAPSDQTEDQNMNEIAKRLGLKADADEQTILAAIDARKGQAETTGGELSRLAAENSKLIAERDAIKAELAKATERERGMGIDKLCAKYANRFAVERDADGAIVQTRFEKNIRALAANDIAAAEEMLESATVVSPELASPTIDAEVKTRGVESTDAMTSAVASALKQCNITAEQYAKFGPHVKNN